MLESKLCYCLQPPYPTNVRGRYKMNDQSDEQIALLKEIVKWVRFNGFSQVKDVLQTTLDSNKKKLAYNLSDGNNTTRAISQKSGIGQPHIVELWKDWSTLGLGEYVKVNGYRRFERSFDLKMFGITISETQTEIKKESIDQKVELPND